MSRRTEVETLTSFWEPRDYSGWDASTRGTAAEYHGKHRLGFQTLAKENHINNKVSK